MIDNFKWSYLDFHGRRPNDVLQFFISGYRARDPFLYSVDVCLSVFSVKKESARERYSAKEDRRTDIDADDGHHGVRILQKWSRLDNPS